MGHLMHYLGGHKWMFLLVAVLVLISTGANILGTYLLKPVINEFILPGDVKGLLAAVAGMAVLYLCGVTATFGYNQLMVITAQKVIKEIRQDLFAHVQKLPLKYYDAHTHGELMSRFTNDVDTVQEAMNSRNPFFGVMDGFLLVSDHFAARRRSFQTGRKSRRGHPPTPGARHRSTPSGRCLPAPEGWALSGPSARPVLRCPTAPSVPGPRRRPPWRTG